MKKLLIFMLFAALVFACAESDEGSQTTSSSTTNKSTAAAPDGEKIYKTNCIACHGLYGDMGASGAVNLKTSELPLEERINVITNGRNTMAAFGPLLKEEQIKAVAEYTLTLSEGS